MSTQATALNFDSTLLPKSKNVIATIFCGCLLAGCATSFEVGPVQGGACRGSDMYCIAYIQGVTKNGGRVVSMVRGAVWTGRENFAQETASLTNQNCLSRGFAGANLSPPVRLPDLMIFRQIQEFTCVNNPPLTSPTQQMLVGPSTKESVPQTLPLAPPAVTIDQAREKCRDLGIKEKTEAFGTCVLRLMK